MAIWRPLPAAALAAVVLATAATPAAAAATVPTTTTMTAAASKVMAATTTAATTAAAILTPSGRQCTQAGDFPHHDGCSATVRGVSVPLPALRGRWYMWDLSNNAKDYYKTLLGIGFRREVTCPTMDNTVSKGVVSTKLCMRSRARPGGRITTTCARFRIRRAAGRRGRYDPAAPLVWRWAAGPRRSSRRRVGARVTILAAVRFPARRPPQVIRHVRVSGGPRAAAAAVRAKRAARGGRRLDARPPPAGPVRVGGDEPAAAGVRGAQRVPAARLPDVPHLDAPARARLRRWGRV